MMTMHEPIVEASRVKALLVRELQSRFTYTAKDEHVQTVCFRSAALVENTYLLLEVDTTRIPRKWTVSDLDSRDMLTHLSAVCGHPVQKLNSVGLTYAIRLIPQERRRLPQAAPLDMAGRPDGSLWVPLGVGYDGPVWVALQDLGHVLIAGCSGSGKSSWVQAALAALLTREAPQALQVVLIDAKKVELTLWRGAPHVRGFASDVKGASDLLQGLLDTMDERGALLEAALCRSLAEYNRKAKARLPYILVVIDELIDLALEAGGNDSDFMRALARIASKGRAYGVLLWASAQHPRWDSLDRRVVANMASRVVFRVVDGNAANMVGAPGAEKLPLDRPGRYVAVLGGKCNTLQGYYLDTRTLAGVARGLAPVPTAQGPRLTDDERRVIAKALDLGAFHVNGIYEALGPKSAGGVSRDWLKATAKTWERRGWLTADHSDPTKARAIAQGLLDIYRGSMQDGAGDVGVREQG